MASMKRTMLDSVKKESLEFGWRPYFLYSPGGSRRIFALAEAISDPEHNDKYNPQEEGSCRGKINIRYLINLHLSDGIDLDEINTGQRDLMASIQRQSHIRLFPDEYQIAFNRMQQKSAE
jgi:hypothetical protein